MSADASLPETSSPLASCSGGLTSGREPAFSRQASGVPPNLPEKPPALAGRVLTACASYRLTESLILGRFLYVDDLMTLETARSQGHGRGLFRRLGVLAKKAGARALVLDAALGKVRGHRFYFREGLAITAVRFVLPLADWRPSAESTAAAAAM